MSANMKQEEDIKNTGKGRNRNSGNKKKIRAANSVKTQTDLLYHEKGTIIKKQKNFIKVALVYPNTYEAGMSSLGFQKVYSLINDIDHVVCERVFLPVKKKKKEQDKIKSCETGIPLASFDIIAFSVSFENDYLNLISILKKAGIPLRSSERDTAGSSIKDSAGFLKKKEKGSDEQGKKVLNKKDKNRVFPLIAAGGVACFLNPEPLAPFVDIFLLGEAELLIKEFFALYDPLIDKHTLKHTMACRLKGAYVPSFYEPSYDEDKKLSGIKKLYDDIPDKIKVRSVNDLSSVTTTSAIVTSQTVFKNIFLIETGRGCPHGCRFCSAGFIYRPPRFYPDETVIKAMDRADKITDKIGLVSAAVSDHPGINRICAAGIKKGFKISFSSLRVDALTDDLIESLVSSGVKTATIAPEAGSEKMRKIINKKIEEKEILSAAERLVDAGIINLKLYFMIGLPYEEDDDAVAIVELTEKIMEKFLAASRKRKKIGTITLSINPFIPKPSTPFQWSPMASLHTLKRRMDIINQGLKRSPNIRLKPESQRTARINALLSRGDRRMADLLENAYEKGWAGAMRQAGDYCSFQLYHKRCFNDALAWDILDTGIKKEFLAQESSLAENQTKSPDCPMIQCEKCHRCMQL